MVRQYDAYCRACDVAERFLSKFDEVESSLVALETQLCSALTSSLPETLITNSKSAHSFLSSFNEEIHSLELLKDLPDTVQKHLGDKNYSQAVEEFLAGQEVAKSLKHKKEQTCPAPAEMFKEVLLEDLKSSPSTEYQWRDIEQLGKDLRSSLRSQFNNEEASPMELIEWLNSLKLLKEPHSELCTLFLSQYQNQLTKALRRLEEDTLDVSQHSDWLSFNPEGGFEAFVKQGCSIFLQNVRQMIGFYANKFISDYRDRSSPGEDSMVTSAVAHLTEFCDDMFRRLRKCVHERAMVEADRRNIESLARCYGVFWRELTTVGKLLPKIDTERPLVQQISEVAEKCCLVQLEDVQQHLLTQTEAVKIQLDVIMLKIVDDKSRGKVKEEINSLLKGLVYSMEGKWRTCLEPLTVFMMPELMFTGHKTGFCATFKNKVLQHMIYGYMNYFWQAMEGLSNCQQCPGALLVFFRVCKEYEKCLVPYIFTTVVDKFQNPFSRPSDEFGRQSNETLHVFTHLDMNMCDRLSDTAKKLVDRFVFIQGDLLAKLVTKMFTRSVKVVQGKADGRKQCMISPEGRHFVTELGMVDFLVETLLIPDELDPIVRQTPNARAYCHLG